MAQDDHSPITFVVPGQELPGGVSGTGGAGALRGAGEAARARPGRVKAAVRVGALRAAGPPQRLVAVPGEDVVALHVAGGPVLMLHPATARDLLLAQSGVPVTRGAESGEIEVGAQLRWKGLEQGTPTRGLLGDVVLAAVEVLTGFAKDKVVDWAAGAVVRKVDDQVDAGVYALAPDALPKLKGSGRKLAGPIPASDQPVLLFIHGTFVESTSTFGKLWALHPQRVRDLFKHYSHREGERDVHRVYALEHETLGKSPIANALTLARMLPDGAKLHLVTHSRGGLVAEVLARVAALVARGGLTDADRSHFDRPEYATQLAELEDLAALLNGRGIQVERVVRVACPARGTLLASKRLDAYLSVLQWSIEATGVPLVPEFIDFLAEVARQRADPEAIPGLAAMIPGTPLVNWLNAAPAPIPGELRVVAGDLEGDSIGSWLKTLLTDAYYWTDNDIVVQTRSMYAGAPRSGGATFLLDQSGKTTHFAYFANPRTVDAVVDALILPQPPAGFETIGPLSWAGKDAGGLRGLERDPDKPCVFVLPGILGSNLKEGEDRIWLSPRLIGGLDRLSYQPGGADGVRPDGPIGLVYDDLIDHLGKTHEVRPFAFDWRRPIEEEAQRLADEVDGALDARKDTRQPVRLLAHSMGGLVARTMQIERPDTWTRLMSHERARLLMLGTPNGGSYAPMQVLSGDDTFGNVLAALGSPLRDRKAREIMAAMPGFLQLQAGLEDPASPLRRATEWDRIAQADYARVQQNNWWHRHAGEAMEAAYRWGLPSQAVLDRAIELRAALDRQRAQALPAFADKMCLVVGRAKSTPIGWTEDPREGFVYLESGDGDGRVPLASALLPGVKTWRLDCEHGSLPSAKGAFDAFVELLDQGQTGQLAPYVPTRGGAEDEGVLRHSRPSRERRSARPPRSEASVFDVTAERAAVPGAAAGAALQIRVLNGNLSFVAEPLLVGHYRASELTGTEAVVDAMLGGIMSAALRAGLYPDDRGAHQVFVNRWQAPDNPWRPPRPQAVVVVGLGDEGGLREADLVHGVRQAVLAWGQRLAEERERASAATELAATLIGSGGLGVSVPSAARAIARGVREANLALAEIGWPVVSRLTLVELFLDRASEAWQGLQVLAAAHPQAYVLAGQIGFGTGPLRRQLESGYRGAAYDLVTATSPAEGVIEFALDTRRARTELRSQRTQVKLIRELVSKAATHRRDDPTIGRTLFQLLVPVEIEPFLGGTDRMVLDLDPAAAAIPWELLDAGVSDSGSDRRPWAVRSQLLRRLRRSSFRAAPRDAHAEDQVLVIGEPALDPGAPYAALPAAREEAIAVQETLAGPGGIPFERVRALVDQPAFDEVIGALLERPWRIVHIAGHGESIKDGQRGVVLSGKHFLGPNEIESMRTVPELVFVNCCHLAAFGHERALRPDFDPSAFAAGVAEALIAIGVRCVVACGWAVEDGPALEFARRFYRELLRRTRFVEAVAAAREACWLAAPLGKSWAAYQCYGDPNWVFDGGVQDAQLPRAQADEFAAIASPVGLALALETLAVQARFMGRSGDPQKDKLRQLETRFGAAWGDIGAVAEAFGVAWDALGGRKQAIGWLERAVKANDASASLKADDTLQNLSAREAWAQAAKQAEGAARSKAADTAIAKALTRLEQLAQSRPTAERWNLLGSAHKRLALIERRAGHATAERKALRASLAAYRRGMQRARRERVSDLFYPAQNCMALDLLLRVLAGRAPGVDPALRSAARTSLAARSRVDPDFWSQVGLVEFDLCVALAEGRLTRAAAELAAAWADVHRRVDSTGWWSSVADQGDLLLGAWVRHGPTGEREAARELWRQLLGYAGKDEKEIARQTADPAPPAPIGPT